MAEKKKQKKKSLPHTRAVQRDRSKRLNSAPTDEEVVAWMEAVVHPAVYAQLDNYYAMGTEKSTAYLCSFKRYRF